MMSRKTALGVIFCLLALSASPLLYGQATGSLSGTVTDTSGSVVPGASVTVTAQGTGLTRNAKTDDTGHYLVPLLPVADYTVRVEFQGFQPAEQKDLRLQVDEHRELDFSLSPATVTQEVLVSSVAIAVQTSNPTLGQVITAQQVAQLPLNGRNFVQLATLTPGTVQETNPHSFFNGGGSSEVSIRGSYSLSVGGSRASSTDWLLDGNDNNELTAGAIAILPSIDAIQEFKVLTYNYSAQYGTRAGPTVLVTTKSGSNEFHGTAFEFLRNTKLDARSFFAPEREVFIQNQFGGSLGGPIKKDKTFFFADYQGKRLRQGKTFFGGFVPTVAMRTGDFTGVTTLFNPYTTRADGTRDRFQCDASGNTTAVNPDGSQVPGAQNCDKIPGGLVDSVAQQMINLYPLPNVSGNSGGNYVNSPVRKLDEGEFDIRLDHNFSSQDSLFARFSYDQATSFLPGGSPGFAEPDAFGSTQNIADHGRNAALSETHIFSGNTINQLNVGYNRIFNFIQSFGSGSCKSQELGIPGANLGDLSCGLTSTIVGGGFWSLGDRGFAPFQGGTNVFTINDSFDMIRGSHDIKIGGEIRANQMNVATNAFQDGFWIFTNLWTLNSDFSLPISAPRFGNNMADFLLGLPGLALHDQTFQGSTTGRRWKLFRPYIQDDWRVNNNLTLNLGLAWALVTPITENHDRQANFDFATGTWHIAGQGSDSRVGVKMDKTAIEPRFGLAWRPRGSQKTAIRAGYAIFHDSSWNQGGQGLWENPPYFQESAFFGFSFGGCPTQAAPGGANSACFTNNVAVPFGTGRTMTDGFPLLTQPTDPSTFGGNIQSQNLNFKQGMVQQFNLNVEHQLPGEVLLTVGYAGSRGTHILVDGLNLNIASPTACGTTPGYTFGCGVTSVPYPQFGTIANINDAGFARYDSLQIKAETKSTSHGLYALLGYTYARNFDTGFNDGLGTSSGALYYPLPGTQKADRGLSQIQLNHNFTASVIYDLPFGKGKQFGNGWSGPANSVLGNWQVNVIEHITSGFPLFMVASSNNSGVNFASSVNRPDRSCNGRLNNPTVEKFFDTSCFVDSAPGQLGNSSRTPLTGPGFVNTDFSVNKHFQLPFREGTELEFRAEFFNLFNHPQFYQPGQDVDSAGFGQITEIVNNPRLIQFALKIRF
jgi:Carboxypeptidase regulatory-like domain